MSWRAKKRRDASASPPTGFSVTALFAGLLAAGLCMFANDRFLFESVHVPSSSMRPTLLPNEWAFMQQHLYGKLNRFDVVTIDSHAIGHRIVKRIIGLPGDTVRLEDSWRVVLNGQPLSYGPGEEKESLLEAGTHQIQRVRNPKFDFQTSFGKADLHLGPDEYFVLGDNRLASEDSRVFGPVSRAEIEGKVRLVWYSFDTKARGLRSTRLFTSVR